MPASNSTMIHKLQVALNSKGMKILCNRSQFYSDQQGRPVTIYKVCQSVWNEDAQKYNHKELFSSASQIQVVLFMRNLWYLINDMEIPKTNKMKGAAEFERKWNEFLNSYYQKVSNKISIGLSPSGKAQDFDSQIRGFESRQPCYPPDNPGGFFIFVFEKVLIILIISCYDYYVINNNPQYTTGGKNYEDYFV